jgi:hypothetical protein
METNNNRTKLETIAASFKTVPKCKLSTLYRFRQNDLPDLKFPPRRRYWRWADGDMSLSSGSHAIFVAIIAWKGEHRGFVIETYLKNGDSIIAT